MSALENAKAGTLDLDEFAQTIVSTVEVSGKIPPEIAAVEQALPGFERNLGPKLLNRLSAVLLDNQTAKIQNLKELKSTCLPKGSASGASFDHLLDVVQRADKLLREGRSADVEALAKAATQSAEKKVLFARLAKGINGEASKLTEADDPYVAMKSLSEYDLARSSEGVAILEKLLNKIFEKTNSSQYDFAGWNLEDVAVQSLLKSDTQLKPELKVLLLKILERRLSYLIQTNKVELLTSAYTRILEYRPDPSAENDELRKNILFIAQTPETQDFARGRLEELKYAGDIDFLTTIRIVRAGYYGSGVRFFLYLAVCVVLGCPLLLLLRPFLVSRMSGALAQAEADRYAESTYRARQKQTGPGGPAGPGGPGKKIMRPEEPPPPKKKWFFFKEKQLPGYMRGPVEQDEYSRLLEFFGLDDSASEAQIKKAYRDKVKNLHPDKRAADSTSDDQDFIELKQMYDRLLQVRSSWFGVKK